MPISQEFNEKTVFIKGLKANYKIQGEGDPFLILHGWRSSSNSWISVQKILAIKGFKIIIPDFPGFGNSETPKNPWSVDDYIEWLKDFIEETKINTPVFLLGHSFGGRVAIKFSVKYPETIKSQILLASAGIKPELNSKQRIFSRMAKVGNFIFSKKPLRSFKNQGENIFYYVIRQTDYLKVNKTMRETMKKILAEDLSGFLIKIKQKTLIIWGKKDKLVPVMYAYMMKEKILNSKLIILPDSGHSPHLDNTEKLAEIITDFLRS